LPSHKGTAGAGATCKGIINHHITHLLLHRLLVPVQLGSLRLKGLQPAGVHLQRQRPTQKNQAQNKLQKTKLNQAGKTFIKYQKPFRKTQNHSSAFTGLLLICPIFTVPPTQVPVQ
jgi:hypothetical protein